MGDEVRLAANRRARMGGGDDGGSLPEEVGIEPAAVVDAVEGEGLVEATHVHQPLDRHTLAAERKRPVGPAHDGNGAEIERRREGRIDLDLPFAGNAPQLQGREVHERKAHRPLHLVDVRTREHDDGAVGLDRRGRRASSCGRGEQEGHHVRLGSLHRVPIWFVSVGRICHHRLWLGAGACA